MNTLDLLFDDLEEALSRRVGDIAAHRLVGTLRDVAALQADAARRLAEGLIEYAVEEQPLLAPRVELEALAAAGARLHEDLEHLEKRLARLAGEG
jgi:ubiquinone biosynthesis protein UbiJ